MLEQRPDDAADAAFIEQIAPALRTPVRLSATFEARTMAAVRAERAGPAEPAEPAEPAAHAMRAGPPGAARHKERAWWRRPRTFVLSPIGSLALAAGFAGVVALGTVGAVRAGAVRSLASGSIVAADTVHVVRFVFVSDHATHVSLAGDFNGWSRTSTPLSRTGVDGVWSVTLPVQRGRYEYAFIVDGTQWSTDPLAQAHADDYGTQSSVLTVGDVEQ